MSILIKGAEIPKKCCDCDLLPAEIDWEGQWECPITGEIVHKYVEERKGKPPDCPLIEIPPHGRLIDADKLKYNSIGCWAQDEVRPPQDDTEWLISKYDIDEETPTVIESEERDHE